MNSFDRSFWAVFLTVAMIGTTTWLAIFEHNYDPRIYRYSEEVNDDSQICLADNGHGFGPDPTLGSRLRPGTKRTDRHAHGGSPYGDANAPNSNTH